MGSSQFSILFLFITFFSIIETYSAQVGFDGRERDALFAIKFELNNSFLIKNWTGLMCYLNDPPVWYGISCLNGRVSAISLDNLALTGTLRPDSLHDLTELSILSLKNNSISGEMMEFSNNPKMTRIDLSRNRFGGVISNSLTALNFLESLQLQDNDLTGTIPDFNQPSLREFNVSNNDLSGKIPTTSVLQSFGDTSYKGNDVCGPPISASCDNSGKHASDSETNNSKRKGAFDSALGPILLAIGVVGLVFLSLLLFFYYKKTKKLKEQITHKKVGEVKTEISIPYESSERSVERSVVEMETKGKLSFMDEKEDFELSDLLKASAEGLGKGNFGNSYKAVITNGSAFVVKRLRDLKPLSRVEFAKHLKAISDQKHPNLLPLIAYFYSKEEKLLVYKFAAYGNVFSRLHGGRETKGRVPFRWAVRLATAQSVARALEHLHLSIDTSSNTLVPHGNLKSSNVLIDENNNILVSDYGLISLIALPIAAQKLVAFKSPEYIIHKRLSKKSDVWSYGCFLLELLTGRKSAHDGSQGEKAMDLGVWVHRAVREEWTAEIFDLEIAVQRSANHAMAKLLQIAIRCCDKSPEQRPEMAEVVREVESIKVVVDSEDSDMSLEQSLTDDSLSASLDGNP